MWWYCILQHFLVLKIDHFTHRLLNVNICRWAEVIRWLSNILNWSGVTSCQQMPRDIIYCMCWYCILQHFLVLKLDHFTHRLLNVNICRWAEVIRWLSNILNWSGVTSCQQMPRDIIYCMCWYCILQHFMLFKRDYLIHRLLNVIIFRVDMGDKRLSNILSWSGVTSCQLNVEKSHLLHVLLLHFAALPVVRNRSFYSSLAQCQYLSMSRGCQMTK